MSVRLGADAETIHAYARQQQTVSEHQQRIGEYLRLRTFDTAAGERLARFLEDTLTYSTGGRTTRPRVTSLVRFTAGPDTFSGSRSASVMPTRLIGTSSSVKRIPRCNLEYEISISG